MYPTNPEAASFSRKEGPKPKGPVLQGETTTSSITVEFEDQVNLYKVGHEYDDEDVVHDIGEFAVKNMIFLYMLYLPVT